MRQGHLGKTVEHSKNHQEIEGWVSGLANLEDGIAGGANRKHKDEVRETLLATQTVLSHPEVLRRQPLPNEVINKSAEERRDDLVNSATTLLSRQLRAMVDASVEDFVSFFTLRFDNSSPAEKAQEWQKLEEIRLHKASWLAFEGLVDDFEGIKRRAGGDMLFPAASASAGATDTVSVSCYPDDRLPFAPRILGGVASGACRQLRRASKASILISALKHAFAAPSAIDDAPLPPRSNNSTYEGSVFQRELVNLVPPLNESVLLVKLVLDNDHKIQLKPSFEDLEAILVEDTLSHISSSGADVTRPALTSRKEKSVKKAAEQAAVIKAAKAAGQHVAKKKTRKRKKAEEEEEEEDRHGDTYLRPCELDEDDASLRNARRRLRHIIRCNTGPPLRLLRCFRAGFEWLFSDEETTKISKLSLEFEKASVAVSKDISDADGANNPGKLVDCWEKLALRRDALLYRARRLIRKYRRAQRSAERTCGNPREGVEHYPLFAVDCKALLSEIKVRTDALVQDVMQGIAKSNLSHMQRICSNFEQIGAKLVREPTDAAELKRLAEYSETCVFDIEVLERVIFTEPCHKARFLMDLGYVTTKEDVSATVLTLGWPLNILEYRARSTKLQNMEKAKREEVLLARREYFSHELKRLEKDLSGFKTCGHTTQGSVESYCNRLSSLKTTLEEAAEEARTIDEEETLLGFTDDRKKESSEYRSRLGAMMNTHKTFDGLWSCVRSQQKKVREWSGCPPRSRKSRARQSLRPAWRRAQSAGASPSSSAQSRGCACAGRRARAPRRQQSCSCRAASRS